MPANSRWDLIRRLRVNNTNLAAVRTDDLAATIPRRSRNYLLQLNHAKYETLLAYEATIWWSHEMYI